MQARIRPRRAAELHSDAWEAGGLELYHEASPSFRVVLENGCVIVNSRNVEFLEKGNLRKGSTMHSRASSTDIERKEQEQAHRGTEEQRTRCLPLALRRLEAHKSTPEQAWQATVNFMEDDGEMNLDALERTQQYVLAVGEIFAGLGPKSLGEAVGSDEHEEWQYSTEEYGSLLLQQQKHVLRLFQNLQAVRLLTRVGSSGPRRTHGSDRTAYGALRGEGFSQTLGINCSETWAPVFRPTSVRAIMAVVASEVWPVLQFDVKSVFLKSEMEEEIYITQPKEFEIRGENGEELV